MGLPKVAWLRIALGAIIVLGILVFYRFSVHDRFIALRESWEQERTIEAKILELREENIDLEEVIEEIAATRMSERGGSRADDRTSDAAMEDRKREGYF